MNTRRLLAGSAAALLVASVLGGAVNSEAGSRAVVQAGGLSTVPRPDHVVVVMEENRAGTEIVGSADAPYITSLAAQGANFTSSFAVTHPSQPNYLAIFSGGTQGLTDDSCPHTYTAPSLADQLYDAGLTFTGYSESLPSTGYTGCVKAPYARKHSPWINFPSIPASANQPFSAFPSDYATLPEVSFVIPNLQNDMHDGTIAQGDTWLRNNLDGYARWAKTHNSLLIVTYDEDDYTAANRIATVIVGERVAPGNYPEQINHYNVLRTIEDAFGLPALGAAATATPITDIWSAPSGDTPPVAAFTRSCTGLSCTFDAGNAYDPDGSIVGYQWDFGDGTSATGVNTVHAYASGGRRTATLTVADDQGATDTTTRSVSVVEPGAFAADLFDRTVTGGLGTADIGGAWTLSGAATGFSVAGGSASLRLPSTGTLAGYLPGAKRTDTDVRAGLGLSAVPTGKSVTLELLGRRVASGTDYDAKLIIGTDRSVTIRVARTVSGTETVLGTAVKVPGLLLTAGQPLNVRLQVSGTNPTTVRARVWAPGTAEPTAWTVSATDSTPALQAAGMIGVLFSASSSVTNYPLTALVSAVRATPSVNNPPVAAFTPTCRSLSCDVDAGASSDPDGSALTYAWTFGDGASGTGVRVTHAYPTADNYVITLTVTDPQGLSSSTTRSVTTTPPPLNNPPHAAFTASCPTLACTFDGRGSTDDEGVVAWTWDFDDAGLGGDGAQVSHTFPAPGNYDVALTVSDDEGATDTVTTTITITDPTFVRDAFNRTVTKGFGTADLGGPWTVTGTATAFGVSAGVATISQTTSPGTWGACVCGVTRTDADVRATVSLSAVPVGNAAYIEVEGRRISNRNEYAAKLLVYPDKSMTLRLVRVIGGTETIIANPVRVPGAVYSAGRLYVVRVQVSGTNPTSVRARVWSTLDVEPTSWLVSATDTTAALQAPGATGVLGILPSSVTGLPLRLSITAFSAAPTA